MNYNPQDIINDDNTALDTAQIKIWNHKTLEEKIDFIYKELKAQKRNRQFKFFFKIAIFATIIYLVFFYLPNMSETIKKDLETKLSWYITQTVGWLIKNMTQDMTEDMIKQMEEKAKTMQIK